MSPYDPSDSLDDMKIVDLYFARDERAIEETQLRYGRACMRIAMDVLGSRPDAEECVSDTLLKTWDSIPPNRPRSLYAYVCRIVRNLAINRLEHLTAARRNRDLTVSLSELEDCMPIREEVSSELSDILSHFLRGLPDLDRRLFLGRYWYAMSVKDLAAERNMTPNAVSLHLRRTREQLRAYLTERGYTV